MARNKRSPDHESVIEITKRYAEAEGKLRTIILEPGATSFIEHTKRIIEATKITEAALSKVNKRYTDSLAAAYKTGEKSAINKALTAKKASQRLPTNTPNINTQAATTSGKQAFKAVRRGAFIDLQNGMTGALAGLRKMVADTIRGLDDKNRNLWEFTQAIEGKLKDGGLLELRYENGAHIRLDHYAKMLARSSRIETENLGMFAAAERLGTDLVKCIGQSPTCELCAIYRDRVFSVSGKDKRFPALNDGPDAPLRDGYHTIHPNCRCEFIPYFEDIEGKEQVEKDKAFSNRPFRDNRTKRERDEYAAWQAGNRLLLTEQAEYENMKAVLGENMPYKTLGGFRRARRDYNDGVKIDKPPNLRYNNYAKLKRGYKTLAAIRTKGVAKGYVLEYVAKMEETYHDFKASGVELTDHSINRFLGQKIGRGKQPFTKDEVLNAFEKPPNYIQEGGREVHYYNNVAVVVKPETGEVITVNSYLKESRSWKKL